MEKVKLPDELLDAVAGGTLTVDGKLAVDVQFKDGKLLFETGDGDVYQYKKAFFEADPTEKDVAKYRLFMEAEDWAQMKLYGSSIEKVS